jgi:rhomboid family GlyGly-CTERM serine protease
VKPTTDPSRPASVDEPAQRRSRPRRSAGLPWLTAAVVAGALAIAGFGLESPLQFERDAVARGEVWRLLTAHLTHFGRDHLQWDLLAFGMLGVIAERWSRRTMATALGISAIAVSVSVWLIQPQFSTYRGLSGLDSALFGIALAQCGLTAWRSRQTGLAAFAALALAGFVIKSGYEWLARDTWFVREAEFEPVPLAHIIGALSGAAIAMVSHNRRAVRHREPATTRTTTRARSAPASAAR